MKSWKAAILKSSDTILNAIRAIDESEMQIALIVDSDMHLLGTVTDGDIRRGILRGVGFDESIKEIYNKNPVNREIYRELPDMNLILTN